jgi:hypothetical protein
LDKRAAEKAERSHTHEEAKAEKAALKKKQKTCGAAGS